MSIPSPPGTSAVRTDRRPAHLWFTERADDVARDIAAHCEREVLHPVCTPSGTPNVFFSNKCADSDIGRGFTAALTDAVTAEWAAYVNSTVVDDALEIADAHESEGRY